MLKTFVTLSLTAALAVCAMADPPDMLQDNYLGNPGEPGWTLPYDGIAAESSERNTMVTESWTGDDLVVPEGLIYTVQQIRWIGFLQNGPGAEWNSVDVVIYERNPADEHHPISPGDAPVAEFTDLAMDSFEQQPGEWYGLDIYEGTVTIPDVELPPGHYYYAVRVVGNGRGRHYIATTGGGIGTRAGEMGIFQSNFFYEPDWINIDQVLQVPDPDNPGGPPIPWATDFAYQVRGVITPEPASLVLLSLGLFFIRHRR